MTTDGLVPLTTGPAPASPRRGAFAAGGAEVGAIAVLPGGDTAVACSPSDPALRLVSLARGEVLRLLHGHDAPVNHLALDPAAGVLVSGGDDATVRVWDTATWTVRHVLRGHGAYVRQVAVAGGRAVSGAEDRTVRVWDLATGRCERVLDGHRHDVIAVAISPDGRRAASAALDNELRLWDLVTGAAGHVLYDHEEHVVMVGRAYLSAPLGGRDDAGHSDAPAVLAFDPSGEVLWSAAREIIGWAVATGAETVRSTRRGWPIEAVVPGPGGLAFASDEAVGSWDPAKGSFTLLDVADERVTALAAVPGGGLAGGTRDGRILTWEGTPGPGWAVHAGSVHRAVVAPGSRAGATLASDGGIRLWDLTSGRLVATLDHDLEAVRGALAFTTDGRALVTGGAGHLHRWDAATGAELDRADEPRAAARAPIAPNALLALPDGGVLAGLLGEGFRRWDTAGLMALEGRTSQISSITLAGDGGIAVTTGWFDPEPARDPFSPFGDSRSVLQGWDLATGTLRWSVAGAGPPPGRLVGGVHFGFVLPVRGGVVTCAERDGTTLVLRDPATGASRRELEVPGLTGAHRLADGGLLLVTGEGDDRACVRADPELDGLGTPVRVPAFAELLPLPSGRAALLRADDGLLLVSLADGTVTGRFAAAAPVITVAAGDDGRTVLAGDRAGRVHVLRAQGR